MIKRMPLEIIFLARSVYIWYVPLGIGKNELFQFDVTNNDAILMTLLNSVNRLFEYV